MQRVCLTQGADVYDGIVVEPAAECQAKVAEIGLGERVSEPVGEGQEASAGFEESEHGADLSRREEGCAVAFPSLVLRVIAPGWRRDDEQTGRSQEGWQWLIGGAAAFQSHAAERLGETGEVGVQFAGREAGLRPVGLAVAGVEERLRSAVTLLSLNEVCSHLDFSMLLQRKPNPRRFCRHDSVILRQE